MQIVMQTVLEVVVVIIKFVDERLLTVHAGFANRKATAGLGHTGIPVDAELAVEVLGHFVGLITNWMGKR